MNALLRGLGVLIAGIAIGWWLNDRYDAPVQPGIELPRHVFPEEERGLTPVEPAAPAAVTTTREVTANETELPASATGESARPPEPERSNETIDDSIDPRERARQCLEGVSNPADREACSDLVVAIAGSDLDPLEARQWLTQWLLEAPDDIDAAFALAGLLAEDGEYIAAAETLAELQGHLANPVAQDAALERVRRLVRGIDGRLSSGAEPGVRRDFYRLLVTHFPAQQDWRLSLAESLISTGEHQGAMEMLNFLLYDPEFGERTERLQRELLARVDLADYDAVALEATGSQFIVGATLNDVHDLRLLIDTGASVTALRESTLRRFGVDVSAGRRILIETAGGAVPSTLLAMPSLAVGGQRVPGLEVVSLGAGDLPADGLLGMNFLGRFHFVIDQQRNLLLLQPRRATNL